MVAVAGGPLRAELTRSENGHRDYKLVTRVRTNSRSDGPLIVMNAVGLPLPGSIWIFGNETDPWAACWPNTIVRPYSGPEADYNWTVEQTFSTRPYRQCNDMEVSDPLLKPPHVEGSFITLRGTTIFDANGNIIKNTAFEPIEVEKDGHAPTVVIEQNVGDLGLSTFSNMVQTVNDASLWGLSAKKIKLNNVSWQRRYYGMCGVYYTRRLDFEIRWGGWAVSTPDQGFRVIRGYWHWFTGVYTIETGASKTKPEDFVEYRDKSGSRPRDPVWIETSTGKPKAGASAPDMLGPLDVYPTSNFLTLGIPTVL